MNVEGGFQLDLLGALRRRARMMFIIAGLVLLTSYWVAMALPNEYYSSATIFVEPQAISDRLVKAGIGESDINRRLSLMSAQILSRPRLSRVIDELGLYERESESMLREEVIALMRSQMTIEPVLPEFEAQDKRKGSGINTFIVGFTSDSPQTAAAVAQRIANDFLREHIEERVQMTQKSLEFINAEQTSLATRVRQVEDQIAEIKTENAGKLPEDLSANQRLLERTLSELRAAQRDGDLAQSDMAFWENQSLSAAASSLPGSSSSPIHKLQSLELELSEMRARGFTEKYPDMQKTLLELEEVRSSIESSEDEAAEEDAVAIPSLAQQNADASRRRAEMRVEQAKQEIARVATEVEQITKRLEATPLVAARLEVLERDHRHLTESFNDYTRRRQEANVQVDLERRQLGEQFRILEPAYPPPEPAAPNRPLIMVLGLMLGIALGVGAAIVIEGADTSYHGPRDLQTNLGIPVLASIPRIILEPDRLAARRRLMRTVVASAVITLISLAGGATTYMVVNGAPGFITNLTSGEPEEGTTATEEGTGL